MALSAMDTRVDVAAPARVAAVAAQPPSSWTQQQQSPASHLNGRHHNKARSSSGPSSTVFFPAGRNDHSRRLTVVTCCQQSSQHLEHSTTEIPVYTESHTLPASLAGPSLSPRQTIPTFTLEAAAIAASSVPAAAAAVEAGAPSQDDEQAIFRNTPPPGTVGLGMSEVNTDPDFWKDLLAEQEKAARNVSLQEQSRVLRRKGRLKEQDLLIEFMVDMHKTHSAFEVMQKMEDWVEEHQRDPDRSRLRRLIPTVGRFHTSLPLVKALREFDQFTLLSHRQFVPPNFAEIRHVLNIAQIRASSSELRLITFDADGTIYDDGAHIEHNNAMIGHITTLLREGVHVAILTAAGYPGNAARFEERLAGLLSAFRALKLPAEVTDKFLVMGGECNYLLRYDYATGHLAFVADNLWKTEEMVSWKESEIRELLKKAESALTSAARRLKLDVLVVRKERCVGIIPKSRFPLTPYEVLEDIALAAQSQLVRSQLPFCAFNGGNDVFVDIGNKSIGLDALMAFTKSTSAEMLHVGDRFTVSGNDNATRSKCPVLWVASPEETAFYMLLLLRDVKRRQRWLHE